MTNETYRQLEWKRSGLAQGRVTTGMTQVGVSQGGAGAMRPVRHTLMYSWNGRGQV